MGQLFLHKKVLSASVSPALGLAVTASYFSEKRKQGLDLSWCIYVKGSLRTCPEPVGMGMRLGRGHLYRKLDTESPSME